MDFNKMINDRLMKWEGLRFNAFICSLINKINEPLENQLPAEISSESGR